MTCSAGRQGCLRGGNNEGINRVQPANELPIDCKRGEQERVSFKDLQNDTSVFLADFFPTRYIYPVLDISIVRHLSSNVCFQVDKIKSCKNDVKAVLHWIDSERSLEREQVSSPAVSYV